MADIFLKLSDQDRRDALGVAADRSGRPTHLLEKDVWVVWALATLYAAPLGEHLVFKGGTSLSKAYQVIRRFSEDVDLTYDIRAIAPDLVGDNGEGLPKTRSEEKRWSSEVRRRLPVWVAEAVQPVIANALAAEGLAAAIRVEDDKLFIDYEATAAGSGYVAPSVMLEFGARSTGEPASLRDVVLDLPGQRIRVGERALPPDAVYEVHRQMAPVQVPGVVQKERLHPDLPAGLEGGVGADAGDRRMRLSSVDCGQGGIDARPWKRHVSIRG